MFWKKWQYNSRQSTSAQCVEKVVKQASHSLKNKTLEAQYELYQIE